MNESKLNPAELKLNTMSDIQFHSFEILKKENLIQSERK